MTKKAKVKEIIFWSCLAAIMAGIAYLIFIPEDEYTVATLDDDDDEFVVEDDSL